MSGRNPPMKIRIVLSLLLLAFGASCVHPHGMPPGQAKKVVVVRGR
jgi:hypothetical protein